MKPSNRWSDNDVEYIGIEQREGAVAGREKRSPIAPLLILSTFYLINATRMVVFLSRCGVFGPLPLCLIAALGMGPISGVLAGLRGASMRGSSPDQGPQPLLKGAQEDAAKGLTSLEEPKDSGLLAKEDNSSFRGRATEEEEDGDELNDGNDSMGNEHDDDDEDDDHDAEQQHQDDGEHAEDTGKKLQRIQKAGVKADSDGNGMLSAEEMLLFAEGVLERQRQAHTKKILTGIDQNADGKVTTHEAEAGLRMREEPQGLGVQTGQLRFQAADANADGTLDSEEFHSYLHPELRKETLDVESTSRLRIMDINKDGLVNVNEFVADARHGDEGDFSEEDARADFHAHDADNNGILDEAEFTGFVRGDVLLWAQVQHTVAAGDHDADGHIHLQDELPHRIMQILDSEFVEDYLLQGHGGYHHEEL